MHEFPRPIQLIGLGRSYLFERDDAALAPLFLEGRSRAGLDT